MFKFLTSVIFYFIFSITSFSQWTNQNIVPEGNHLWSNYFIDNNIGWMVGTDGFIAKTSNGGLDWVEQNSGTAYTLRSVQFIDNNNGWICGDNGLIIKTSNGGQNWIQLSSGTNELLTDLHFLNSDIGYVVGFNETILKTTNGGSSWIVQKSGLSYDLFSVDFVNTLTGYAVGGRDVSKFLKTTNGGLTWIESTSILGGFETSINCVEFIDQNVGWIGLGWGSGGTSFSLISKTTDGGDSWSTINLYRPVSGDDSLYNEHEIDSFVDTQVGIRSIHFRDANHGYAVGGTFSGWKRSILFTSDGGATWQNKYFNDEQTGLLSVFVNDSGIGWAVGYFGVIYSTENMGFSWSQILSGTQSSWTGDRITSVFMINDSTGWAAGSRKGSQIYPMILKTTNAGKTWKTIFERTNNWYRHVSDIFFVNENIGWASISDHSTFKTTDGGITWTISPYTFDKIFFMDQDTGWGAHSVLGIYKSTNGGLDWVQKSSVRSSSIYFSNSGTGWAVGSGGNILKSTDGGDSWFAKISGTTADLKSVHFYNSNIGVCVGNEGTILLTTDGGENWNFSSAGCSSQLNSVLLTNATTIWIAGANGTILNSTDLGNNWTCHSGLTTVNLSAASFINENTGWFGGENGTILKFQNDVIPVELMSFKANPENNRVLLNWQTSTEINNLGYDVERKTNDGEWIKIGFVHGHGNSTSIKSYSYVDVSPVGGSAFSYRLKQIDIDGSFEYSDAVEVELLPIQFELSQNYPNPFNPSTTIKYHLPIESKVTITIYDILGSEILTLVNETKDQGIHEVEFNANSLSSGTYIYRIVAVSPIAGSRNGQAGQSFVQVKKMVLIK